MTGYAGWGVWVGSVSAAVLALMLGASLLVYFKLVEEKELEARFGVEYLEYKKRTPFLIPRFSESRPSAP